MKLSTRSAVGVAVAAIAGALIALVVADRLLDDRKKELLATGCKKVVDVPSAATLLNYLGVTLLVVALVSLVIVVVTVARGTARFRALSIVATAFVFVVVGLYAALVAAGTVSPSSDEPSARHYHPCGSGF
ncbi:hypothetical protein [Nocardia bovistercoris]|uniref:Uncharacterized protein n=1 Tax=Nocardia bovistercoris TaxID=2785916 RepID=A0A931N1N5_9NOCA|nr:hypothetical protein [Nocardia bovistercoris]MBH0776134.1 hypothetical protein [Nocardia bovistercoris]